MVVWPWPPREGWYGLWIQYNLACDWLGNFCVIWWVGFSPPHHPSSLHYLWSSWWHHFLTFWARISHPLESFEWLPCFHSHSLLSIDQACHGFHRHNFWGEICGQSVIGKVKCNEIQYPSLRLMHKWMVITLFLRNDHCPMRNDELMILYAICHNIKVSLVQAMICQWLTNFKMTDPISCTFFITRIAEMAEAF